MTHLYDLPPGSAIQQIKFVSQLEPNQTVLLQLPAPFDVAAVAAPRDADAGSQDSVSLRILTIPAADLEEGEVDTATIERMRSWVEAGAPGATPSLLMSFQRAHICWSAHRCAILAHPEKLSGLEKVAIEFAFYEAELRAVEESLRDSWPELENDMPRAFEFNRHTLAQRPQIRERFQQTLLNRARLARISPYVHTPHVHPATLASQFAERLRDRTRILHRHESAGQQMEVFERVYEMAGQRASDYLHARSGHLLEWIIIAILIGQTCLWLVEMWMNSGTA